MSSQALTSSFFGTFQNTNDWLTQAKVGLVPGVTFTFMVGANQLISTSYETVWNGPTGIYAFPTSGSSMTISSTDANDTLGGTGANILLTLYLDSNYDVQQEIILMNGLTPVVTVATDIFRMQLMIVISVGATGGNVGTIYTGTGAVVAGVPANVFALITVVNGLSENVCRQAVKTVPNNKIWIADSNALSNTDNQFMQFVSLFTIDGAPRIMGPLFDQDGGAYNQRLQHLAPVVQKTDFNMVARVNSGNGEGNFFLPIMEIDLTIYGQ